MSESRQWPPREFGCCTQDQNLNLQIDIVTELVARRSSTITSVEVMPNGRNSQSCRRDQNRIGCHTFRATGITAYLKNGGRLEVAADGSPQIRANDGTPNSLARHDLFSPSLSRSSAARASVNECFRPDMRPTSLPVQFPLAASHGSAHVQIVRRHPWLLGANLP